MYIKIKPGGKDTKRRKICEVIEGYREGEGRRKCEKLEWMNKMEIL
jgi:hypothetical protein